MNLSTLKNQSPIFTCRKLCVSLGVAATTIGILNGATRAHAQDSTGTRINKFVSGTGTLLYIGGGVVRPLLRGRQGAGESLRTADALITSVALTEGLKRLTREKRPDGSGDVDSFPSGHTTAAFAVAAIEAHYHPKEALYWYGGAVLIAESRVGLRRHYVHDVVAGAAVGYLTAQWAIKSPRGLVLSPVIRPETGERGFALAISY